MNLNNILLIITGVIGLGVWMLFITVMSVIVIVRSHEDPVRLQWLATANFMWLQLIFSIAAIGFGIYNWRR
jgi:formate-dependent nitrite reductase membrane component NrfD